MSPTNSRADDPGGEMEPVAREELRERIARELYRAVNGLAPLEGLEWPNVPARERDTCYESADRILSDPQIERALRIAKQEPVAWRWKVAFSDGTLSGWSYGDVRNPRDVHHQQALVPLTTEPSET